MWKSVWALLLLISIAGAQDTNVSQLLGNIPACGLQCYHFATGETSDDSLPAKSDFCNEEGSWAKSQDCILLECSVLDRLWINEIQIEACDEPVQTREKRFYYLLTAEIPAWIFPGLRLFSSWKSSDGVRWDDYVMLGCGALYTVYITCVHLMHHALFDIDSSTVNEQVVSSGLKMMYITEKFGLLCLGLAKICIAHFYLRTFSSTRFRLVAYSTMILVAIPTIALVFVLIFQCSPISFVWNGWKADSDSQQCLDIRLLSYIKQGFDIGQNVLLLTIPLPFLCQLNMSLRAKLGAVIMFVLGILAVAMSSLRLQCIIAEGATKNEPWDYTDRLIWIGIEISALIIIACLPSVWKLCGSSPPSNTPVYTTAPRQTRFNKDKPLPPITTKIRKKASVSRKPSRGVYSGSKGTVTESQLQLDLQLGDKARGDVWTQIKGGHRFSGFSMISHMGDRLGIRVKTTTTTQVEVDDSDGEEDRVMTPRPGPLSP
ncbi:hypothetical protein AK830_g5929 [Neonectria ditissima]|uniref:Rhodopsin domain-containing protein n=1 Tax=Neonectria ditissima TaxID=78410 RepID=A0A0P7AS55_9HYPO|nr:hypothetical protein AK830_g5929 [Neonectria ditissima]